MTFWGIELKPGKVYPIVWERVQRRLHITQATLGDGTATKRSTVRCSVAEKDPIYLCSLLPDKMESCPLNLEFEEDAIVSLSVVGPRSVHLSGFLEADNQQPIEDSDDYEFDSFEVDTEDTETEESAGYGTGDEYDDDFIDGIDDARMYPPSSTPNSGVVIEEIVDEEKPLAEISRSKRQKKKLTKSDEDCGPGKQIIVKSSSGVPVLESEDEDGFPVSKSRPVTQKDDSGIEKEVRQTANEEIKKNTKDDDVRKLKRKADSVTQDDHARRTELLSDPPHSSKEVVSGSDIKKKKKKVKEQNEKGQTVEASTNDNNNVSTPAEREQDWKEVVANEKSLENDSGCSPQVNKPEEERKKKKKKKSKAKGNAGDSSMELCVKSTGDANDTSMLDGKEEKPDAKPSQVRTYPNGLIVEELAMGKPDGKRASPGKKVSVHYIGKLRKDGKIFDSNIGKAPFKFRLGVGQVIKGWDVGVNGMRIGDKRRFTIPPSMGYGAQGAGKKIPPNSWLMFDVELVEVQ